MRPLVVLTLTFTACAEAGLIKGDFLPPGDGFLIQDIATSLDWLSPVATRGQAYDGPRVQNLQQNCGFQYASYEQTANIIISNFGLAPNDYPGDAAGFTIASNFMNVFGVAEQVTCWAGMWVPCPRTPGRTSSPGPTPNADSGIGLDGGDPGTREYWLDARRFHVADTPSTQTGRSNSAPETTVE